MNALQKQFILISHAAVITLALPLGSYALQWLNSSSTVPASLIHPDHQVEAQIVKTQNRLTI